MRRTAAGPTTTPRSLPNLWAKTSDAGRHAIAEAVFERIDVLGVTDYTFTLTAQAKARGWDAAFGAGVVRTKEGRSGRGERTRPFTIPIWGSVTPPPGFRLVREDSA